MTHDQAVDGLTRRGFLRAAAMLVAGVAIDPERLLWTPSPTIVVPSTYVFRPQLTLAELARRMDPDGRAQRIIELLASENEILDDIVWRVPRGTHRA